MSASGGIGDNRSLSLVPPMGLRSSPNTPQGPGSSQRRASALASTSSMSSAFSAPLPPAITAESPPREFRVVHSPSGYKRSGSSTFN